MNEPIFTVDAFAEAPFTGNPAAVCLLDKPRDESWMQSVAAEMNLAETAFLTTDEDGFRLRWFTPAAEVDLCGHATLASAHILWQESRLASDAVARFHTKSGLLTARRVDGGIELEFPALPAIHVDTPMELPDIMGTEPAWVGKNSIDYLALLDSESTLRGLQPDVRALAKLTVRGLIVTAESDDARYDFVSRFFAPAVGIDEDPVTGSAHCCLGPFWQTRLNKSEFLAYQPSKRGGVIGVRCAGDRAYLTGQAVTTLRGNLTVD